MAPAALLQAPPSRLLAPFVRGYEERRSRIDGTAVVHPQPGRTRQILEVYLADRYRVRRRADGLIEEAPRTVVVGVQTWRKVDLLLTGDLHVFTVQFTPTGFSALFGQPMDVITDEAPEASALLGGKADDLAGRLADARDFAGRVVAAETWLAEAALGAVREDPVREAADRMRAARGAVRIDALTARSGLSGRQFERRFIRQVGVAPKRYARLLRFGHALMLKGLAPQTSWAAVAQDAGYFDQAHMVRDFQALAEETPGRLLETLAPHGWDVGVGRDVENIQSPRRFGG